MVYCSFLKSENSYELALRSKEWGFNKDLAYESLAINKGVLTLYREESSSYTSHFNQEIKFKLKNNIFLLIGEERIINGSPTNEQPDGFVNRKSINYLSGKVISSTNEDGERKENTSTFKEGSLPLADFSLDTYRDNFKNEALRGY